MQQLGFLNLIKQTHNALIKSNILIHGRRCDGFEHDEKQLALRWGLCRG